MNGGGGAVYRSQLHHSIVTNFPSSPSHGVDCYSPCACLLSELGQVP